jgi:hypothetical protein
METLCPDDTDRDGPPHVGGGRGSAEPGLAAVEKQMLLTTCGKPTASSSKVHLCYALCCYIYSGKETCEFGLY